MFKNHSQCTVHKEEEKDNQATKLWNLNKIAKIANKIMQHVCKISCKKVTQNGNLIDESESHHLAYHVCVSENTHLESFWHSWVLKEIENFLLHRFLLFLKDSEYLLKSEQENR